jgi:hypothetical protein
MNLSFEYLSGIFREIETKDKELALATEIVKQNSDGKIWLVGGSVYRNLIREIYGGTKQDSIDFDFIVENEKGKIILPEGWKLEFNHFGNPKFVGKFEIDFVPLKKVYSIAKRKLEPTIENYLIGTPLNIHSIAYGIDDKRIIGEIGRRTLEEKVVRVNDLEMAREAVKKYGQHAIDMAKKKAEDIGFRFELI